MICARRYPEDHEAGWKNPKHCQQWANTRTYTSPAFGSLPAEAITEAITTEHVVEALRPIWLEKTETACRLRQRIERVVPWAAVQKFRQSETPARWRGHFDHLLPPPAKIPRVTHHPATDYRDARDFMARLRERDDITSKALAFTVLTACRTNEILGAIWDEIDWEARI